MGFDFKTFGLKMAFMVPYLVMGIQQLHEDAKGATKKQLAMEALGFATNVADSTLPDEQKGLADAVSGLLDSTVSLFHETNAKGFGENSVPEKTMVTFYANPKVEAVEA